MTAKRKIPSPLTVLMIVVVIAALATWVLPSGKYATLTYNDQAFTYKSGDKEQAVPFKQQSLDSLGIKIKLEKFLGGDIKKPVSVPGTYSLQPSHRQGIFEIIKAPIKGVYEAIDIVFLILLLGSFMRIFNASGAMDKGLIFITHKMKGKEYWLIIILTFLFSLGGSTFGMAEEAFPFYPLLAPLFLAAGYDMLIPVAVILGGTSVGYISSITNPFSTIIASNAAGVNWTDGFYGRLVLFFLTTGILTTYIIRYAQKIKRNPSLSLVLKTDGDIEPPYKKLAVTGEQPVMSWKTKLLLIHFAATFIIMVLGVTYLGWWLLEMTALFFASTLLLGFILKMKEKTFIDHFIKGAEEMLTVALIVGVARGVTIILNEGQVSDTIVYNAANAIDTMPPGIFLVVLLILFMVFTLFIPSSSGMAVLTMPIMGSLAVMIGVPGKDAVNAYLIGMGIMGFLTPTGLMLPALAMVNVSVRAWFRFIIPLLLILLLVCSVFLILSFYFSK
jgi:uncharacterized ion transporter superfamily protein YfcC